MQAIIAVVAALAGIVVGFLLRNASAKSEKERLEADAASLRTQLGAAQSLADQRAGFEPLAAERQKALDALRGERDALQADVQTRSTAALQSAARISELETALKNEQNKYAQMKADLDTAFKGAAADALRANTQSFLALAKQELGGQTNEAKKDLEAKETAIKNLLDPLDKALKSLDAQAQEMEKTRAGAYAEVKTLVTAMQESIPKSLDALKNETTQLIGALRAPKTRGNWGELQLRRCVEAAGMVDHVSFSEQVATTTEEAARLQPDMTIHLPNGRTIVVEAKTPSDLFSDNAEIGPAFLRTKLVAHAASVKTHIRSLSGKAYWKQFEHAPEFVVCFLPTEALFSAALEGDPSLIEFGAEANVVLATPTTLIALLKAVAYGWHQSKITENAKAIQKAGEDLYSKLVNAHEYFTRMGKALQNAVGQYNNFVGAIEGRGGAFFHARRLGSIVHEEEELETVEPLAAETRVLTSEDWAPTLAIAASAEPGAEN